MLPYEVKNIVKDVGMAKNPIQIIKENVLQTIMWVIYSREINGIQVSK